jgi:uncharacterized protein YcfL
MKKIFCILISFLCFGCAANQIMKDCKRIEQTSNGYVCKTIVPWYEFESE